MGPVTYQTIRLSKGKHTSKDHGACVMELASMLADEPFSDHPASVCPVIASLLRAYNDSVDDRRRQDLYVYAARVVGSRGSAELERMRTEHVTAWMASPRRDAGRASCSRHGCVRSARSRRSTSSARAPSARSAPTTTARTRGCSR